MKPIFSAREWAIAQAAMAAVLLLLIPLVNLLAPGGDRLVSVLHGAASFVTVALACQAIHQLYPLLRGKEGAAARLELTLWLTNALVLATIVFGNWLYIDYRLPDQAQQWLLFNNPAGHSIIMEFKEFVSLFPLPLGVGAAWILRRFRESLPGKPDVASAAALLVTLMWGTLLCGLVFGLALAKLKLV
ncbi:hypothetical protein [Paenibacillus hamazuiensis]|uniref:hypothetical protein n=1 Tax=Paenibacillus hamazuiensis TaxID=2936508 RepID=UPI00200EF698|nr:hypothetical protein [Paenibacillus hamazuiensis]